MGIVGPGMDARDGGPLALNHDDIIIVAAERGQRGGSDKGEPRGMQMPSATVNWMGPGACALSLRALMKGNRPLRIVPPRPSGVLVSGVAHHA